MGEMGLIHLHSFADVATRIGDDNDPPAPRKSGVEVWCGYTLTSTLFSAHHFFSSRNWNYRPFPVNF